MAALSADTFESLVADVAGALEAVIPTWRARLGAASASYRARGLDATVLDRAAALPREPDVDALLTAFDRAARQLAGYEAQAAALDPSLAGSAVFRDPARVREAAALVAACRSRAAVGGTTYPDGEHWVLAWPDVGDLLAGELA